MMKVYVQDSVNNSYIGRVHALPFFKVIKRQG